MKLEKSTIEINDVRLYAFHGVLEQERQVGGEYSVSICADYNIEQATLSDNVNDTLNYALLLDMRDGSHHQGEPTFRGSLRRSQRERYL